VKVLESLKELLNEATWDCSDTGIQLQVLTRKIERKMSFFARGNDFSEKTTY
jgi:hypothetical protein